MAPRPRRPAPLFLALALLASALGLAAAQQAAAVPAYLRSPFGARDDVCPPARGGAYEVNGFPGTPFVVTPFKDEFRNPPLAKSKGRTCRGDGHCIESYHLNVEEVELWAFNNSIPACASRRATKFLAYGGSIPGPTIRVTQGTETLVRFRNNIDPAAGTFKGTKKPCDEPGRTGRPFSVHHHGSASLAPFDGWAEDVFCANEAKDYVYPNNRPGTGWYHDHAVHITANNAYYGLAGSYIVTSAKAEGGCGEPFGLADVPENILMIGDRVLDKQCQLHLDHDGPHKNDVYGDINLVNGIPFPSMNNVEPRWQRFRLLNVAASRPYNLKLKALNTATNRLEDVHNSRCWIIAADGGYRSESVRWPAAGLVMGAGERYESICNFEGFASREVILYNDVDSSIFRDVPYFCYSHLVARMLFTAPPAGTTFPKADPSAGPSFPLMKKVLSEADIANATAMVVRNTYHRNFQFGRSGGQWVINGETWDTAKIAAADIGQNTWELWRFETGGGWFHPVHMHLVDFFIIGRVGKGVRPYELWSPKDVVYLGPSETIYIIARFGAHRGDYMFHCHNLIHEDNDMMRAFRVRDSESGRTAPTLLEPYVMNPLHGLVYGNFKFADPMSPELQAKNIDSGDVKPLAQAAQQYLDMNLYRIFYPLPEDQAAIPAGMENPWRSRCLVPPQ